PPLECCFGTSPIQAEKSRPDWKALGSATLATKAVAQRRTTPGISSSRLLAALDRCQAMIRRSNSSIPALITRNCTPRAGPVAARARRQLHGHKGQLCVRSHRLSALEGPWPDHEPGLHPDEGGRSLRQSDDRPKPALANRLHLSEGHRLGLVLSVHRAR